MLALSVAFLALMVVFFAATFEAYFTNQPRRFRASVILWSLCLNASVVTFALHLFL